MRHTYTLINSELYYIIIKLVLLVFDSLWCKCEENSPQGMDQARAMMRSPR